MKTILVVLVMLLSANPVMAAQKRHPQKQEQKQKKAEEPSFLTRMKAAFLEGWNQRIPRNSPQNGESGSRTKTYRFPGGQATIHCDHCGQTRR